MAIQNWKRLNLENHSQIGLKGFKAFMRRFFRRIEEYNEAYRKSVMETLLLHVHDNRCDAIFTVNDSNWTEEEMYFFSNN